MTDLAHMTKTLKSVTGNGTSPKTFANLSKPRALLVVHSGKTTSVFLLLCARLRMALNESAEGLSGEIGTPPVARIICQREVSTKPMNSVLPNEF